MPDMVVIENCSQVQVSLVSVLLHAYGQNVTLLFMYYWYYIREICV